MAYTAIDNPELYFQAKLYTGSGGTQSITLDGDEDMQPDLIWIKSRADTNPHTVVDAVRGATKVIWTNVSSAEGTYTDEVTAFDSDGFTLGASSNAYANENTETHVAWCWKESATAGFDIISYTGDGSDRDLSHSLSASPEFIIIKQRSGSQDWSTQSTALGLANYVILNDTNASAGTSGALVDAVSSSTISVDDNSYVNGNTSTYIGYLWRSVQGFSAMGKYTGNGNADGAFVYTGFKPAMVIQKMSSSAGYSWHIFDNKRDTYNPIDKRLFPDATDGDSTSTNVDFLSNGFKFRSTATGYNGSGNTFIYMAFAEAPFVNSNGVPCNAR
jgi:hypothetical protein